MPRLTRRKSFTETYHIMLRGINKEDIFLDVYDNMKFIKILKTTKDKYNFELYGYCLMKNHTHLIIKHKEISLIMQSLAVRYASYFNKKYDRIGHLFQDRFRSKVIENKAYLKNVIRYVHQNPVKAGICKIDEYNWSSYNEYINKTNENLIDKDLVLSLFDDNNTIQKFKEFMAYDVKNNNWRDELEFEIIDKITDEKAEEIIREVLKIHNVKDILYYTKSERNEAIKKISKVNEVSCNQIARVIGISSKTIQRILKMEK